MTFSPLTTRTSGNGGQFSSRGRSVDRFIVHHGATTSLSGMLSMFATGSRQVSANYAIKDQDIVGVVPEEYRAWTSGSASWDGRSITVETANSFAGGDWPISEESYVSLAKLIADCSTRYGFPLNRDTVIGHRELNQRYGDSYPTLCPGGINLDRLVTMAREYQAGTSKPVEDINILGDDMYLIRVIENGNVYLVNSAGYLHVNTQTVEGVKSMTGRGVVDMHWARFLPLIQDLNNLVRGGALLADDDLNRIAKEIEKNPKK